MEILTSNNEHIETPDFVDAFFYVIISDKTILFNRINSSDGRTIYPDLTFSHPYMEESLSDDTVFRHMEEAIKKYGTSHCFCLAAPNNFYHELISSISNTMISGHFVSVKDNPLFIKLCKDLNLSVSMQNTLEQYFMYESFFTDTDEFIQSIYKRYDLFVQSKKEGKIIYESIKREITG